MIPADETFDGTYPFAPQFLERTGFSLHYVDAGRGDPVVLVHGEPTWGYLWRHLVDRLATAHRVVVPDHMGFGKSATPPGRTYDAAEHVQNLEALLVEELDLAGMTLVLHDWGGTIGGRLALRHPDRIKGLVLMNTVVELGLPHEPDHLARMFAGSKWFTWMSEAVQDGRFEAVLGNLGMTVLHVMYELQGIVDAGAITPTMVRAYAAPFMTPEECVGAMAFPRQIVDGTRSVDVPDPRAVERLRSVRALMISGQQDRALPPAETEAVFRGQFPHAPIVRLARAGHFPPEDQPDAVLAAVEQFLAS